MVPKTERFEMRLDPAAIEKVDVWRRAQGNDLSRSEAIRQLVDASLRGNQVFQPSKTERLQIWLLCEILKHLKGHEDDETVKLIQNALYGGHLWALEWKMTGVVHDEIDSEEDVRTVVNILDMWMFIERTWDKLSKEEEDTIRNSTAANNPRFLGFDGNNETNYMGIARFLVEDMDRFSHFKGREFNSHMPTVGTYSRMADRFMSLRPKLGIRDMDVNDMIMLLQK